MLLYAPLQGPLPLRAGQCSLWCNPRGGRGSGTQREGKMQRSKARGEVVTKGPPPRCSVDLASAPHLHRLTPSPGEHFPLPLDPSEPTVFTRSGELAWPPAPFPAGDSVALPPPYARKRGTGELEGLPEILSDGRETDASRGDVIGPRPQASRHGRSTPAVASTRLPGHGEGVHPQVRTADGCWPP